MTKPSFNQCTVNVVWAATEYARYLLLTVICLRPVVPEAVKDLGPS